MWKPTGRHFTLYASSPLTRILEHIDEPVELTPSVSSNANLTIESSLSSLAHMTGDRKRLVNFVEKFIGTVRFGNDQVTKIIGYRDYQMGETIISRVYYVEGLKHNLFSVG
uniref:Integrase, catalytic region, zinc finger, CCHC-type, peptidase aspartic, catalytic n=1 Tax=Tanacetum cinerariifolium TaxID=118510 RepID=A0A699R6N0_TANCI|nr:integrase, catalytic region, zinc finger, CCHC-type, peptidase aspartic, catalytic [Tanacetum cinerariifolium]